MPTSATQEGYQQSLQSELNIRFRPSSVLQGRANCGIRSPVGAIHVCVQHYILAHTFLPSARLFCFFCWRDFFLLGRLFLAKATFFLLARLFFAGASFFWWRDFFSLARLFCAVLARLFSLARLFFAGAHL